MASLKKLFKAIGKIDWSYPLLWGADLDSFYRSIWLGWWLITWCEYTPHELDICFQPGL